MTMSCPRPRSEAKEAHISSLPSLRFPDCSIVRFRFLPLCAAGLEETFAPSLVGGGKRDKNTRHPNGEIGWYRRRSLRSVSRGYLAGSQFATYTASLVVLSGIMTISASGSHRLYRLGGGEDVFTPMSAVAQDSTRLGKSSCSTIMKRSIPRAGDARESVNISAGSAL